MNKVLYIILISLFSLTIISCSSDSDSSTSTDNTTTDTTAPSIGISGGGIPTITNDNTPDYTFSSSEAGTIIYGGSCSSSTTSAIAGSTTVTFNTLSDGTYTDCTITVTDSAGNPSNVWIINPFVIVCSSGCFVAVGSAGNIVRSNGNGTSWDNVTSPTGNALREVTF